MATITSLPKPTPAGNPPKAPRPVPTPADAVAYLESYTVVELREACKASGRKGYSTLSKAALIHLFRNGEKLPPAQGSVAALRLECKDAGIKGVSLLTKAQLQTALDTGTAPTVEPKVFTLHWLKAVARKNNVVGRSKANTKAELEQLLDAAGIDLATASV
jgi:hypothetical protein